MKYNSAAMKFPVISAATEGCLAADLELLVDRAIHSASIRYIKAQQRQHQQQPQQPQQQQPPNDNIANGNDGGDEVVEGLSVKEEVKPRKGKGKEKVRDGIPSKENENEKKKEKAKDQGKEAQEIVPSSPTQFEVVYEDFVEAQKGFTPAALKGIKLHKSEVSWDDIGGDSFLLFTFQELIV